MKKELTPGMAAVAIVCVVVIVGYFIWKGVASSPEYPGLNAPPPTASAEPQSPTGVHTPSATVRTKGIKTSDQAAGRIPGASPRSSGP